MFFILHLCVMLRPANLSIKFTFPEHFQQACRNKSNFTVSSAWTHIVALLWESWRMIRIAPKISSNYLSIQISNAYEINIHYQPLSCLFLFIKGRKLSRYKRFSYVNKYSQGPYLNSKGRFPYLVSIWNKLQLEIATAVIQVDATSTCRYFSTLNHN